MVETYDYNYVYNYVFFINKILELILRTVVLTKENSHHSGFYKCTHLIGWLLYMYNTIIKHFSLLWRRQYYR